MSDDPLDLLDEWLTLWAEDDHQPAKLPNALQVRTAVALAANGRRPSYMKDYRYFRRHQVGNEADLLYRRAQGGSAEVRLGDGQWVDSPIAAELEFSGDYYEVPHPD